MARRQKPIEPTQPPAVETEPVVEAEPTLEPIPDEVAAWIANGDTKRRVRVHRTLRGALTNENPIFPGEYIEDDPALMGLAEYLVDNQYGVWA